MTNIVIKSILNNQSFGLTRVQLIASFQGFLSEQKFASLSLLFFFDVQLSYEMFFLYFKISIDR